MDHCTHIKPYHILLQCYISVAGSLFPWPELLRSRVLHYYIQAANSHVITVRMCRWSRSLAPVTVWYQRNGSRPHFSRFTSENVKQNIKRTIKFLHLNSHWVMCCWFKWDREDSLISAGLCFGWCPWTWLAALRGFLTWSLLLKLSSLLYTIIFQIWFAAFSHHRAQFVFLSPVKITSQGSKSQTFPTEEMKLFICIFFSVI